MLRVDRDRVLAYRGRASHLDRKLQVGSLATAAAGGLQDSAPRAAVISLHARVEGVGPTSWEDPSLVQIWFRGGADYVVPRADLGVFTLGSMPRDAERRRSLEALADAALDVLAGETLKVREVAEALKLESPNVLRLTGMTGRVLIRWDASNIWLIGCDAPAIDPEDARIELARRFLRWLGPQSKQRFTWWAGIEPDDAAKTWDALASEIVRVDLDGTVRWILDADADALSGAEPIEGVRLVPHGDPLIKFDGELMVADAQRRLEAFPRAGTKSDFWPVSGGVIVDGQISGAWARQQRRVTVNAWRSFGSSERTAIEAEALAFPIPSSTKAEVRWASA